MLRNMGGSIIYVFALSLSITACGQRPVTAIFQNTEARSQWSQSGHLIQKYESDQEIPEYLTRGIELYLLIQTSQPRFLYNKIDQTEWNRQKISDLRVKLPAYRDAIDHSLWLRKNLHRD